MAGASCTRHANAWFVAFIGKIDKNKFVDYNFTYNINKPKWRNW